MRKIDAKTVFGAQVRNRREALGLTRKELARRADCSMETVRKIESGERHPSQQIAALFAEALSISQDAREGFIRLGLGLAVTQFQDGLVPSAAATNLPASLTSFIDRTVELTAVRTRLLHPDVRLLTLVGPPGIGKTRLSIQAGNTLLDSFADGVWFLTLAPMHDPSQVLSEIANIFEVPESGALPLIKRLQAYLHSRETLLLLDNFEHILDAAPQVTSLLKACPRLKVIATSRQALQVYGEHEFLVPALSLPPRDHPLTFTREQGEKFDALRLFVVRAQAFQPSFELNADNVGLIAQICARLDGVPLAIELAVAQLRRFTPQALLDALNKTPLQSLIATARDVEPRQRTLRDAIQWSYDLLPSAERVVFDQLGVFAGGWTMDAALAVCELPDATLPFALADQNLIQRQDESRWTMLEMIREFALERLPADARVQTHQRHAAYLIHQLQANHVMNDQIADVELHNFRVALRWLMDRKDPLALELFRSSGAYFDRRGLQSEARRITSELLDWDVELTQRARCELLQGMAISAWQQQDVREAVRCAEKSALIARAINEPELIADTLMGLAHAYIEMDDSVSAKEKGLEALKIGREIQVTVQIVGALTQLGEVALMQNDVAQAGTYFDEAYTLCLAPDWQQYVYFSLACKGMGEVALSHHDYDGALRFLREGVTRGRAAVVKLMTLDVLAGVIGTMPRRTTAEVCRAAKIWGATEALHEKMGSGITPSDRRRSQVLIAAARSRISPKTFEAAWAKGRGLSMDDVVALAMT